jgi:YVTN family beta-propeller protein
VGATAIPPAAARAGAPGRPPQRPERVDAVAAGRRPAQTAPTAGRTRQRRGPPSTAQGRHRRFVVSALGAGVAVALIAGVFVVQSLGSAQPTHALSVAGKSRQSATTPTTTATPVTVPGLPSSQRTLRLATTITGPITPKSVVASGKGIVFAQNMMYEHTMTVYDRSGAFLKTIPDSVDLTSLGVPGHPGLSKGAPVEAAFSPDRKYVYVSNYSMYGAGFGPEGSDTCSPASGFSPSFVYRVNVASLTVDKVIGVGQVPKYVAVTPDNKYLLVTNWCSYDMSVIDTKTGVEIKRIPLGPYPRGIAVTPDSATAYIAVMGTRDIAKLDLNTLNLDWIRGVGNGPRHVVMDPAGHFLYATLNADGQVAKIDIATNQVVAKVATGSEPRSMAISADGLSLYVVNYNSNTISKLASSDLHVLQVVHVPSHPIGITYDPSTSKVWVASYSGAILVFNDA